MMPSGLYIATPDGVCTPLARVDLEVCLAICKSRDLQPGRTAVVRRGFGDPLAYVHRTDRGGWSAYRTELGQTTED